MIKAPDDRKYTRTHEWARPGTDGVLEIGVGADDLRMDTHDIGEIARMRGMPLANDKAAELYARTQGWAAGNSVDGIEGAIEVHLKAGDALLFVDAIMHGSARRMNPGQRRIAVYRYGPSWGSFRHSYRPSAELLARLTPQRRQVVLPGAPPPCSTSAPARDHAAWPRRGAC